MTSSASQAIQPMTATAFAPKIRGASTRSLWLDDGVPLWLRTAIGLAYFIVGAAHILLGLMAWHWDKTAVLTCVIIVTAINVGTLELWRARLLAWWSRSAHSTNRETPHA